MRNVFVGVITLLFFASTFNSCRNDENKTDKILDISYNLPLTGDFSTYGDAIRDGSLLAFSDIKASDTSFKFNYSFQDDAVQGSNANSVLQQQSLHDIDIYVSGVKPQTMSIIDKVQAKQLPHFVWVFDANITENYTNTYRTWVNYKIEPQYYFRYVNKVKPKKIAITYVQLPHTEEEFKKVIIPTLTKDHQLLVEPYTIEQNDFKNIGTKLKAFHPDLIIVNGFKANLIPMIKYFKEIGLTNNSGNTICTYDFLDATVDLSDAIESKVRFISPTFLFDSTGAYQTWEQKFKKNYNRNPKYTDAYAYDMVYAIYYASKNVKDYSDPKQWRDELLKQDFTGVTGRFRFDKSGDLITDLSVYYIDNGKIFKEDFNEQSNK